MGKHPDRFSLEELVAAAEEFDRLSVAYIPIYGNPTIRLHAIIRIVSAGCVPCRQERLNVVGLPPEGQRGTLQRIG